MQKTTGQSHSHPVADAGNARERILDAASILFQTRGYENTTIRDITSRSNSSNATLVKYFGNKRGLFLAYVSRFGSDLVDAAKTSSDKDIEDGLIEIGTALLRRLVPNLVTYRAAIGSINSDKEIGRMIFDAIYLPMIGSVADYLEIWARRGTIVADDSFTDAERFIQLLTAGVWQRVLYGVQPTVNSADFEVAARGAARIFLHGIAR